MGLKIKFSRPQETPKPAPQQEETIFDALEKLRSGKIGTLMLVHKHTGDSYRVLKVDPKTGKVSMLTSQNMKINPMLTEREAKIYKPMWR